LARSVHLILGCGYTGRRVAARLLARGETVWATTRDPSRLALPGARVLAYRAGDPLPAAVPDGARVLHSIPDGPVALPPGARRVVHLSSTGVYGSAPAVDEATSPAPVTGRQRARLEAERRAAAGPWTTLVLRPAAIYGPGRGVHEAVRAGRYRLVGDGSNATSRIHVDDLAALCVAALDAELEGAYPAADAGPAPAREVAAYCAALLGVPLPPSVPPADVHETLRFTRAVDGRAVLRALDVSLAYPTYREGIAAALSRA